MKGEVRKGGSGRGSGGFGFQMLAAEARECEIQLDDERQTTSVVQARSKCGWITDVEELTVVGG